MRLGIEVKQLQDGSGYWIASVRWGIGDAGQVGTPGAIKYGETPEEAYNLMCEFLKSRGYIVIYTEDLPV